MYLIKVLGVDLGATHSGVTYVTLREGSWETSIVWSKVFNAFNATNLVQSRFEQQLAVGHNMMHLVEEIKPDIVAVEDCVDLPVFGKKKGRGSSAMPMGQMAGVLRTLLWSRGVRILNILPQQLQAFIEIPWRHGKKPKSSIIKEFTIAWIKKTLNQEFQGNQKEITDMADSAVYGLIGAVFFSSYWLKSAPKLGERQTRVFYSLTHSHKGYKTGLLDTPQHYLIRNKLLEGAFHGVC